MKDPTITLFNMAWEAGLSAGRRINVRKMKTLLFGKRKRSRRTRPHPQRLANPNFWPENHDLTPLCYIAGWANHSRATKMLLRAGAETESSYQGRQRSYGEWLGALAIVFDEIEGEYGKYTFDFEPRMACARILLEHDARTDVEVIPYSMTVREFGEFTKGQYPEIKALLDEFPNQ